MWWWRCWELFPKNGLSETWWKSNSGITWHFRIFEASFYNLPRTQGRHYNICRKSLQIKTKNKRSRSNKGVPLEQHDTEPVIWSSIWALRPFTEKTGRSALPNIDTESQKLLSRGQMCILPTRLVLELPTSIWRYNPAWVPEQGRCLYLILLLLWRPAAQIATG